MYITNKDLFMVEASINLSLRSIQHHLSFGELNRIPKQEMEKATGEWNDLDALHKKVIKALIR